MRGQKNGQNRPKPAKTGQTNQFAWSMMPPREGQPTSSRAAAVRRPPPSSWWWPPSPRGPRGRRGFSANSASVLPVQGKPLMVYDLALGVEEARLDHAMDVQAHVTYNTRESWSSPVTTARPRAIRWVFRPERWQECGRRVRFSSLPNRAETAPTSSNPKLTGWAGRAPQRRRPARSP